MDDNEKKSKKDRRGSVWMEQTPKFERGEMKHSLVAESSFETKFPTYREAYLKKAYSVMKKIMNDYGIKLDLDTNGGTLTVKTTNKTWDPYSILLARDAIKLVSRHVSVEKAMEVFNEGVVSEIMEIKKMCREGDTFIKRRDRLCGKDNGTLKALEKITQCSITVQGGTVAIIGPYKGVAKTMNIVSDSMMKNSHPVYLLKQAFQQVQLEADPSTKDANWSQLIPSYSSKTTQKKKKKKKVVKKEYNPMPPSQLESKYDKKLVQGEVFVSKSLLKTTKLTKEEQKAKSEKIQAAKRAKQYIAPIEPVAKKRKRDDLSETGVDIEKLKKKVKLQKKKSNISKPSAEKML